MRPNPDTFDGHPVGLADLGIAHPGTVTGAKALRDALTEGRRLVAKAFHMHGGAMLLERSNARAKAGDISGALALRQASNARIRRAVEFAGDKGEQA